MPQDTIKTTEENIELIKKKSIENTTGIDMEISDIDPIKAKIIKANINNPIILAMYIIEDSPTIIRTGGGDSATLYKYNGKCFDYLTSPDIDKMCMDFLVKYNATKAWARIALIIRALRVNDSVKFVEELNPYKDLLNLKNGVLNIKTREFKKHSPEYYFDHYIDVEYDENAKSCPNFINFLDSIFSGEKELIENAIRLGGYLLDSSNKAEKFFLLDGDGGSGKSTLLDTYSMFFIERFTKPLVTSVSLETLSSDNKEKTDLIHSRFNQCAETKKGYYDAEFLKRMVTGDIISVSRKNQEPYTFRYQGKVVIACNGLPSFTDTSGGIYRRMLIFNFKNQYKDKSEIDRIRGNKENIFELDRDLKEKIKKEAPSILNLFIEGLLRLREDNYKFLDAESSIKAVKTLRNDSDTAREFLEENYEFDKDSFVALDDIYFHYRDWYRRNVHDGNLKFRSNEMAKRIKETFNIDSFGRYKFFDKSLGKYVRRTAYNLRLIELETEEVEEKDFNELSDMLKQDQAKLGI